jgi:hypothetical protein
MKKTISNRSSTILRGVLIAILLMAVTILPSKAMGQHEVDIGQDRAEAVAEKAEQIFNMFESKIKQLAEEGSEMGAKQAAAIMELLAILQDAGDEWTEERWNLVVSACDRLGIYVDELIPSVCGCIKDEQGNPVYGAVVLAIPNYDVGVPTAALTGGGTVEQHPTNNSSFLLGPVAIPVSNSFVPDEYEAEFNQGGCYWIPVSPGALRTLWEAARSLSPDMSTNTEDIETLSPFTSRIFVFLPGHVMVPYAKKVYLSKNGVFSVTDITGPSDLSGDSSTVSVGDAR